MIGFCERLYLSYLGKLCEPVGRGNCSRRSSSQEGMVDRALCPSNIPGDAQSGVVLLSLFTFQEAKSTLETQQLDSAAAIWLVSNKWLLARFVTAWSIKFRKSLFSFTADIGKDLGTCLGIEGTCWTWMRKKKTPQTGRWRKRWMEDGVMIPCAGVWKKASHLRCQTASLPASHGKREAALWWQFNVDAFPCLAFAPGKHSWKFLQVSYNWHGKPEEKAGIQQDMGKHTQSACCCY